MARDDEREDVRPHVTGGPPEERAADGGAEGDTYRSQKGAGPAMSGEDAEPQDVRIDESANPPEPTHQPGVGKGEEKVVEEGREPGSERFGETGAGRPAGKRGEASGVTDDDRPIDPESPEIPPE
jgi:hypothetical protein